MCRLCGWEIEGWEHVLEGCRMGVREEGRKRWMEERVKEILAGDGSGERWMMELQKKRKGEWKWEDEGWRGGGAGRGKDREDRRHENGSERGECK